MKWLTDHMLVRGINWFVPHAFSAKEFPDGDCSPHFYARGRNPQFRHFRMLMDYTNRVSHLLNGGRHVAEASVLYHAEAEWCGRYMSVKEPMRVLMQAQLDADVVPADRLADGAAVRDGQLYIASERFGCLILPWAERLPRGVVGRLLSLMDCGLRIACVRSWLVATSEGGADDVVLATLSAHPQGRVVELERLPDLLREWGLTGVRTGSVAPYLRRYEYRHDDLSVWMFFNEDPVNALETSVFLDGAREVVAYDPFANRLSGMAAQQEGGGVRVPLILAPEESLILLAGNLPDVPLGVRLGRPYVFDVTDSLCVGENRLRVEVTNTLVHELKDDFSPFMAQEPSGLIGPLTLRLVE